MATATGATRTRLENGRVGRDEACEERSTPRSRARRTRFELRGNPSVAYRLGKEFWGQGLATQALRLFLHRLTERPLYARAASDNHRSIRVLEKAAFVCEGKEVSYANARKIPIDELIFRLEQAQEAALGVPPGQFTR